MSGVILTACVGSLNPVCKANPFDPTCGSIFADERATLINRCMVGDRAQSDIACGQAVAGTNNCLIDPFTDACEQNAFFKDHFLNARDSRSEFCSDLDNSDNSFCGGATIGNICEHNPFGGRCGNDYSSERETIIGYCSDGENMDSSLCPQTIGNCISQPFGSGCEKTLGSYYDDALIPHFKFCGNIDNANDKSCAVALSRPNAVTFLQNFYKEQRIKHGQGVSIAGNLDGTNNYFRDGIFSNSFSVTLNSNYDGQTLGGDSTDGVGFAFFRENAVVGILSGTNLGLPRTETSGTVEWDGIFRSLVDNIYVNEKFTLTVNFGAGEQAGTISAFVEADNESSSSNYYRLTGSFNSVGFITGDILYGQFTDGGRDSPVNNTTTPGYVLGLIGEEGAVAGFISNNEGIGNARYGGGFAARPPSE